MSTASRPLSDEHTISPATVLTLAAGAGFSVASIYYNQPMLEIITRHLQTSVSTSGLIPTLTQAGYALGILFLAPLGDRYDRRTLILIKGILLTLALFMSAVVSSVYQLLVASLVVGIAATLAQDIVPTAAHLAPASQRGKVVGSVMTGLLLGILLSRVVSGFVAQYAGWRSMFLIAAGLVLLMTLILWRRLPSLVPAMRISYPDLLISMGKLWQRYPELRQATLAQGVLSVSFSAFWSTLAVMLHTQFGMGSATAGAFGLAGAAGAMAAPMAGRLADRHAPEKIALLAAGLATLAFAVLFMQALLPVYGQIILLGLSAVLFDFGVQASLVSHQTLIFGLEPAARSRLNALLFTGVFIGMAIGSALGSAVLAWCGWYGVIILLSGAALASAIIRMIPSRHSHTA